MQKQLLHVVEMVKWWQNNFLQSRNGKYVYVDTFVEWLWELVSKIEALFAHSFILKF